MTLRNIKYFPNLHAIATRKFVEHGVIVGSIIASYMTNLKGGI